MPLLNTNASHPALWQSVLILMSAIGIIGSNSLLLSPLVLAVGADLAASPAGVIQAASSYGLGVAAAALTLAPLGDRIGAGRLLRLALLALTAGLTASAAAPNLWGLILAQGFCGLAGGAALPSIYSLAALIAPKGREARTVGLVLTGWTLSMVLGVSLSAWVADLAGWRLVYLALATLAAVLWLSSDGLARIKAMHSQPSSLLTALRVPGIKRGLLAASLLMLGFYISYFFTGAHITLGLGRSTAEAGLLPLFYGIGFGLAVLFDPLLDKLGLTRATPPIFVLITLTYLGMGAVADSYGLLLAMSLIWGIFQHLGLNLLVARLTALDPSQRGAIMGLYSTVTYLCVFAAPFAGGLVFAPWGLLGCLAVSAGLCLLEAFEAAISLRSKPASEPRPDPVSPGAPV
ncbi:Inner membrane transport protein YdhP [Phaeobacter sp. CECT 5382]|uniref:MFS transporter n=1 Tax=Phaeobacter sp. CECT 5382 TaxID=1712645 RepID=UPI0006DB9AC8|nr:MFS transporter [Phaeobacter sp. CECT 5382]CUH89030.1 Inner membrane transport protein YdhP [Phaeobacter sp. CECT 5382]